MDSPLLFDLPEPQVSPVDTRNSNANKRQGDLGELKFDLQACENGYVSCVPTLEALPYDRVLVIGGSCYRIQVKTLQAIHKRGSGYQYNVKSSYKHRIKTHREFCATEIDMIAVMFIGMEDCFRFMLPAQFHGKNEIWLAPTGDNIRSLVAWGDLPGMGNSRA